MYTTISEIKQHLNIDPDFHGDDEMLLTYLRAAEEAVEKDLDKPFASLIGDDGYLPFSIKASVLLLIGSLYQSRESTTIAKLTENPTYRYLINLTRKRAVR